MDARLKLLMALDDFHEEMLKKLKSYKGIKLEIFLSSPSRVSYQFTFNYNHLESSKAKKSTLNKRIKSLQDTILSIHGLDAWFLNYFNEYTLISTYIKRGITESQGNNQ